MFDSAAFDPLTAQEKTANSHSKKSGKDYGSAIVPVPDGVTLDIPPHHLGQLTQIWDYLDEQGRLLFRVCRFISPDGKKEDRPLSYRKFLNGVCRWMWKGLDVPRPLYGLDRLAARPDASVIICEGEKATDAATALFPDYVVVTSPNGASSAHRADWTPLAGRDATIWPDHDDEGRRYAQSVALLAKKSRALSVRIVSVPDIFPVKWDLADDLPDAFAFADIQRLISEAQAVLDPLENLTERVTNDPGEAYKPEVMDALSALQREDMPAFVTLRAQLKRAGVGVTMLDAAMDARRAEQGETSAEPDHLELAREVIEHIGSENILGTAAHVWRWRESGVWRSVVDRVVKQDVQRTLEYNDHTVLRGTVDAVVDVLKTEIHAPEHEWNVNQDAVNVLNGELLWNGTEWELHPHCREHYRTTQIPVAYNPQATCPRFILFPLGGS